MYVRRAVLLVWPFGFALAAACSGDATTMDESSTTARSAALSGSAEEAYAKGDGVTVQPAALSRAEARDTLRTGLAGELFARSSHCFTMVRATESALAQTSDEKGRIDTLVTFLGQYGAAFTDEGAAPLSGDIELEVFRPELQVKDGDVESVHVLLMQRVDGFVLTDSLIGGRYLGKDLVHVAGCLVDPATSAPRVQSLAVPDADAAVNAFAAALGDESVAGSIVKGRFSGRSAEVEWYLRDHRIDAVTGAYLGKMDPPTGDPMTTTQIVGQ